MSDVASFESTPAKSSMPDWYRELLDSVSKRVSTGRSRVAAAANREVLASYQAIGQDILHRQDQQGGGAKIIDRLSADLRTRIPNARGFSPRNLKYMRAFAQARTAESMVQEPLAQLPWYHHLALLEKLDDPDTRLWYAAAAVEHGWSRAMLVHHIETGFHQRSGRAATNFAATLPPSDSDLAQQSLNDPFIFDFLSLTAKHTERELEGQLVEHIEKFLLELGQGFALVGRQVRLEIAGHEFFADLLSYHLTLRCYVVIELKAVKFDPGFLGQQLSMYMAEVDDLLAHDDDKPTILLLLCKSKNNLVVEYALRSSSAPMGVSDWKAQIVESLPEELASSLPSVEELEAELSDPVDQGEQS